MSKKWQKQALIFTKNIGIKEFDTSSRLFTLYDPARFQFYSNAREGMLNISFRFGMICIGR